MASPSIARGKPQKIAMTRAMYKTAERVPRAEMGLRNPGEIRNGMASHCVAVKTEKMARIDGMAREVEVETARDRPGVITRPRARSPRRRVLRRWALSWAA